MGVVEAENVTAKEEHIADLEEKLKWSRNRMTDLEAELELLKESSNIYDEPFL